MAQATTVETHAGKILIKNIGLLLSGNLKNPILDANAIVVVDGKIDAVGKEKDLNTTGLDSTVDCKGGAVSPGLIDSHVHPVFGDWTPRQNQFNWIESFLNGGVTCMISAGEVHLPGRPKDIVGVKSLAITAQRCFTAFRPGGVKIHAGAPVVEQGMVEEDFAEMAKAGVTLLGEIGLGTVKVGEEAQKMVGWARKYGMQSTIHTGGPSVPGSGYIDKDVVLAADADVIGHINGGHTALPLSQIECLCEQCSRAIELVHNGNELAALHAMKVAKDLNQLDRVILGTDSPAGSGVQPLGILRMIALLSSLGDMPPEMVFCFATGNTAKIRNLDGGLMEAGRAADFVFLSKAQHSSGKDMLDSIRKGDLPGIGGVMIDGIPRIGRSRNTPPAEVLPEFY